MEEPRRTRITTLESHTSLRDGLAALISGASDMQLLAAASTPAEALLHLGAWHPDVFIIDADGLALQGIEMIQEIASCGLETHVIALVGYEWDDAARAVLEAGASAFVAKDRIGDQLL